MDIRSKVEQRRAELEAQAIAIKEERKARSKALVRVKDAKRAELDRDKFYEKLSQIETRNPNNPKIRKNYTKGVILFKKTRLSWREPEFKLGTILLFTSLIFGRFVPIPFVFIAFWLGVYLIKRANDRIKPDLERLYPYLFEELAKEA